MRNSEIDAVKHVIVKPDPRLVMNYAANSRSEQPLCYAAGDYLLSFIQVLTVLISVRSRSFVNYRE